MGGGSLGVEGEHVRHERESLLVCMYSIRVCIMSVVACVIVLVK